MIALIGSLLCLAGLAAIVASAVFGCRWLRRYRVSGALMPVAGALYLAGNVLRRDWLFTGLWAAAWIVTGCLWTAKRREQRKAGGAR